MELHDGISALDAEGIRLYAISYDDQDAIADFVDASGVEFTVLSDVDSEVIRRYGVLNTIVRPEDVPFFGIPFPGFFLVDEDGVIVDKLFNRHLANREGIETIIDSFAGRIERGVSEPFDSATHTDGITVSAFLRGGGGVLRAGPRRRLVIRLELPDGLHVYDDPVPDGMVPLTIDLRLPAGVRSEQRTAPPTGTLTLPGVDSPLHVWDGVVDVVIPIYGDTELARRHAKEDVTSIEIGVEVRYQACDDQQCFLPTTRSLAIEVPIERGVLPGISNFVYEGSAAIDMDGDAHLRRLVERKSVPRP